MADVLNLDFQRVTSRYLLVENELGTNVSLLSAHDERGINCARFKKIWVITDFSELHKHIHYAEEVGLNERALGLIIIDVLVIEQTLASGQVALDNMFNLFGQLFFDISFHTAQKEGSQNRLQLLNNSDVETLILINTLAEWVRKPLFEVLLATEDLGHQEVHE